MFYEYSNLNSARNFIAVEFGVAEVVFANEEVWRSCLSLIYYLYLVAHVSVNYSKGNWERLGFGKVSCRKLMF